MEIPLAKLVYLAMMDTNRVMPSCYLSTFERVAVKRMPGIFSTQIIGNITTGEAASQTDRSDGLQS